MKITLRKLPLVISVLAFIIATRIIPFAWCSHGADAWLRGDLATQAELGSTVGRLVLGADLSRSHFKTGSSQFNGEWLFGTYLMTGLGYGQMAMQHPELAKTNAALMALCIEHCLSSDVRAFDREMWHGDPLESLDDTDAHVAYLGYLNLLLGMHRLVSGEATYRTLNDRITAALIRRIAKSPNALLESYPNEMYPVDNCFAIGSIGMHQRVTGVDHNEVIKRWVDIVRARYLDAKTGLLIQAVNIANGAPGDDPRGSGTALGLIPLRYADEALAQDLYDGIKKTLARTWLGFGAVREYAAGVHGCGDIDSGPVIFGYGFSATGFSIAGARMCGDEDYFTRLFASANLCGAPYRSKGALQYVSGGALGNAILFAMLTTPTLAGEHTGVTGR